MTCLTKYFDKMAGILPNLSQIKVTPFDEGFSNKVYLLSWEKAPRLVLRVPFIDCRAFYIRRDSELKALQGAAAIGLSPPMLWCDDEGAFACQYVSQPSLDWSVLHTEQSIRQIAQALQKAHTLPLVDTHFSVFDVIQHYLQGIQKKSPENSAFYQEWQYLIELFQTLTPPPQLLPAVLCHNDINPKNILMDEDKLWLIDWEYVGVGDPLFDLAVVVKSHNLDEEQTIQLLTLYDEGLPLKASLLVLETYVKAYALREMAWLLQKHLLTPDDALSLEYYYEFKAAPKLNSFLMSESGR
ncbi:phosphotransferase [Marinomonas transparens]|uniref:Phosphotransferase n=1 Tax=Marinomonas transparens TaxID=2795388 RepID=A0A934JRH7_9GAMM|nr:phosphotransferase [Marinomonas transparens]MBJ7536931.1 phosphotransferase [Marinomonas transparens]